MNIDINEFLAFARTKHYGERYSYGSISNCPLAQFLQQKYPNARVSVGGYTYRINDNQYLLDPWLSEQLHSEPHRWGALTRRLEGSSLTKQIFLALLGACFILILGLLLAAG